MDVTDKFYGQLAYTELFFSKAAAHIDALAAEEGWSALTTRRAKLEFFASQVGTGADFDLKRPNGGFSLDEIGARAIFDGQTYRYDDFGNINYGFAAKSFGLTLFEALAGAGFNQTFQTRTPDFSNPGGFFDHSRDTKMIKQGFYFRFP